MSTITVAMPKALELWEIDRLLPYKNNARVHSAEQVNLIAQSILEYGFMQPILVDEPSRTILAGHGRLMAAKQLKLKKCPVVTSDHLSPKQIQGYIMMDNKSQEWSTWDEAILKVEFADLQAAGFDLGMTGFREDEIRGFLPSADPDEIEGQDDAQKAPERPVTVPGDVWVIGPHRVICGDCHDAVVLAKLLGQMRIQIAVTSPPYASQRKYDESSPFKPIPPDEYVTWFTDVQQRVKDYLAENGSFFLNIKEHAENGQRVLYVKELTIAHVRKWGWRFVDEFCWRNSADGVPAGMANRFKNAWEPIFHFAKSEEVRLNHMAVSRRTNDISMTRNARGLPAFARHSNVIETHAETQNNGHPAAFPVALPEFFLKAFTNPGEVVYEPFAGSGTTMVAAQKLSRICAGVEISPGYCDVVVLRMRKLFPDLPITLETAEGNTFAEIAVSRGVIQPEELEQAESADWWRERTKNAHGLTRTADGMFPGSVKK